jgi:hypothetical protein
MLRFLACRSRNASSCSLRDSTDASLLKMEAEVSSAMLVPSYEIARGCIPLESSIGIEYVRLG